MSGKRRLSVSVTHEWVEEAAAAVEEGRAPSLSAWVDEALRLKVERDRRLSALARFIADWEAEHGEITPEEMREAARRTRARAVPVRGRAASPGRPDRAGGRG
jgi:Arc/MetJ-type ribon-helix-helix transcriptional regulator